MQRTKSKLLSILLSLVMLLSLLPTTALAADTYPTASEVCVDGNKYFGEPSSYYFRNNESACSKNSTGYNAYYNPTTGTLTLNGYNGGSITVGGTRSKITVVLVGNNSINNGSLESAWGGDITVTSSSGGTLSITHTQTISGSNPAIGIETGYGNIPNGKVTIKGNAKVTINMTHNGTSTYEKAYGIFAKENITISENASVDITCATPNNTFTGGDYCNGLRTEKGDVIIETGGEIKINVTNAGKDGAYSFGIYPMGTATLTEVGDMEVQWKKHSTNSNYPGGAVFKGGSFSDTNHAVNVDTTNCYASYRFGTPRTVMVENGTLTGPGVPNASGSGMFLENDTVNITPATKKGRSGEEIPFKEWTFSDVMLDKSATTASNSFTVPSKDVTVTAKHSPFVGTPTFTPTGTTGTEGTLTFKTVVKADETYESFSLVKEGNENNESSYISIRPDTTSTSSPYEYSYETSIYSLNEGNYYVVAYLNNHYYLGEKVTVNYTAATADISLDTTGPVNFGEVEKGYTTAPAAKTVTITNNGTAATGALTIALDGTHASSFKLSKDNISDIAAGGNATFTVQPKTGLPAGTYTATVKVSGTGLTERSFDVQFTVKDGTSSLIGDVNGDGAIDATDMQRIYAHISGENTFSNSAQGDVNEDGKVDATDMQRIYAHISGENPLS